MKRETPDFGHQNYPKGTVGHIGNEVVLMTGWKKALFDAVFIVNSPRVNDEHKN